MLLFAPCWAQQSGPISAKIPGGGTPPAQVAPPSHYTHVVDSLTQHLDRAGITSGILYDRVMPLAGLHAFNSAGLDTSSAQHFRQAYLELYTAAYNPGTRTRPAYVRERADFLTRRDSVPLAVFDAAFHLLDTLAVQDNLVSQQNGLLYDVAGRSRSPYVAREVVLASPLADTVVSGTQFYFSPELTLSTRGRVVSRRNGTSTGGTMVPYTVVSPTSISVSAGFSLRTITATATATATDACLNNMLTATTEVATRSCIDGEMTMYPNPADEQTEVRMSAPQQGRGNGGAPASPQEPGPFDEFSVVLFTGQGRPVRSVNTTNGRASLDTRTLAPGLYHVQVRWNNRVFNRQLSIQR